MNADCPVCGDEYDRRVNQTAGDWERYDLERVEADSVCVRLEGPDLDAGVRSGTVHLYLHGCSDFPRFEQNDWER